MNGFGYDDFVRFQKMNPLVYWEMLKYAREARVAGRTKLGIWLLGGRVRWDHAITTEGSEYKLPNGTLAYYSRLLMKAEPELLGGMFDTRPMKDEPPWWDAASKVD